jgi:tetratricopeptide (TPR) repeat protein
MARFSFSRLMLCCALAMVAFSVSGCSRDPNVRKLKYLRSGQQYFERGKYSEAAVQFLNATRIDPTYSEAHYQLGQSYLKMQQWSPAYQEFARTADLDPDNLEVRLELTKLLIASNNLPQAQEQVDLLLKKWPNQWQAHMVASTLLTAHNDLADAIAEMQKAITLEPGRSDSYLTLGILQQKNNQPEAAEGSFKKAIDLDPKSASAQLMLGSYYQSHGRWSDAEQQFHNAIASDPGNPGLRGAMARLYAEEGRKEAAIDFLRQAKHDFPDNPVGYRLLGDFFFANGDMDQATAEYGTLLQEHPKDLQVKKNYIQLLVLKHRLEDARKLNDEILTANPKDTDALVSRGQIQIQNGTPEDASSTLQAVLQNDPGNALAHYYFGVALEKSGNSGRAETEWREALRLRPDLVDAQRDLAGLALRKGDMTALEMAATQMINTQPASPDGYALRAISMINRSRFKEAEEDIRRAIGVAPQSPVGYVQLGSLRFVQKEYDQAGTAYKNALDRDVNSSDALRGLINTFLVQNQVDGAVAAAKMQIGKAPGNGGFYDLLGTVLFRNKKDLSGAEEALQKSVELDHNSDAVIKLGQVQAARGEVDQAIATYQQAIRDHPRNANFQVLIGELYESKRDWREAQAAYQQALGLAPNDPVASNNLANVMLQLGGNLDMAMSLAQTARRGMPDSPDAADTLGWVYYQQGAYRPAIDLFQEALRLAEKNRTSEDPDIHYHLGLAYEKTNQPALARQHLEKVLKINPNYGDAAEVKRQLAGLRS